MSNYKCLICKIAPGSPFVLLPYGAYCNAKLASCAPDDVITFCETWRHTEVVVIRKCSISVNSAIFTFMMHSIYGDNMTWEQLKAEWQGLCINEGLGRKAFGDKALLIEYRPYVKEEYDAMIAKRARLAEAKAQEAEKERLLKLAKEGIYDHPSIKR